MISVLDYGAGNLASVRNALAYLDIPTRLVATPAELRDCDRLLLPGVGAFARAMRCLQGAGLADAVREHAKVRQRPLLGICLGMQLLLEESSEGGAHAGLGLLPGAVRPLAEIAGDLVVPHVGWNDVFLPRPSRLMGGDAEAGTFYFAHSYYCRLDSDAHVSGTTKYGGILHVCVEHENIFGCQFHPEKSQRRGLDVLERFSRI